ncbi:sigma-70 family RNA polymerase sigma factor [Maribellus luteus]|uniref:Sigma-70 family RNA polymerase sigma factor n=1 Tax=Maribellus luteus TaxID=2305463 RepID=A0A399SZG1_9BACT|nr:sigma-70 family RNA polymerase sigma factor [Maribellus luteus]RIJ47357.1 sigma-70 family RNA polymerase sigma factor [Maribellus luteus]
MYPNQEKDKFLWMDFLEGSQTALSTIYLNNVNDLFAYGCKFTVDRSLVKDCIQELFVTLIQSRGKLSATDNVKAYLFASLKRMIFRESLRSSKLEEIMKTGDYRFETGLEDLNREDFENDHYSKKLLIVRSAVESLTSRQKEALYLRFYFGLSHKEIAEVLELEEQSSRSLISRAVNKVRSIIKSDKKRVSNFLLALFSVSVREK